MEDFDFTENEIREQLEILGYTNVPMERLSEFKRDLELLVQRERSKNSSLFSTDDPSSSDSDVHRVGINGYSQRCADDGQMATRRQLHRHHGDVAEADGRRLYSDRRAETAGDSKPYGMRHVIDIEDSVRHGADTVDNGPHANTEGDTTISSTNSHRVVRRKVLRRRDGGQREVCDESFTETDDTDEVSSLQERLQALPVHVQSQRPATAPRAHHPTNDPSPVYRLPDDYDGPKALIRPMTVEPHKQAIRKCDPVSRYQQYRQSWTHQSAPGERAHSGLRWDVREHMLHHDQVVHKPSQKAFVANSYKVPSDKKRKNLRWQIRQDLAQGVVPVPMYQ